MIIFAGFAKADIGLDTVEFVVDGKLEVYNVTGTDRHEITRIAKRNVNKAYELAKKKKGK